MQIIDYVEDKGGKTQEKGMMLLLPGFTVTSKEKLEPCVSLKGEEERTSVWARGVPAQVGNAQILAKENTNLFSTIEK